MSKTVEQGGVLLPPLTNKESDCRYSRVIYSKAHWRVILCKDQKQWVIQKAKMSGHKRVWRGISYHTTRKSLVRVWHLKSGDVHGMCELAKMLPDRIGGEA